MVAEIVTRNDALDGYTSEYNAELIEEAISVLGSISTQIDSIKSSLVKLESLRDDLSSILTKLDDKMELLKGEFAAYESEVKAINESQPELSVELTFKGDKDAFRELLKKAFRGSNLKDAKRQMLSENFTDFLAIEN